MATEKQLDAIARHQAKLTRIVIQPYKEDAQKIRDAAARAGQSVTAYILEAVEQRMKDEHL